MYSETFSLMFYKEDDCIWKPEKMNLMIDAPFWAGDKSHWENLIQKDNGIIAMDDNMLAYELISIRYNNLIQVHKIEFFEKYLCIFLDNEMMLSIAYYHESDFAWCLEEYNGKNDQEKLIIVCEGNEIFTRNIPQML